MKDLAQRITLLLEEKYPETACGLEWQGDPYKLLVMAILSAQCTDARVNIVAKTLFQRFPDPSSMATASLEDIEREIHSVGLYRSKSKALKACCERLTEVYGGNLPSEMEELLTLRGVGRKVANLLRGDVFGLGGIVADTHCIRISDRLGLSKGDNPLKTERDLEKLIPVEKQSDFCHRMVLFGREICTARAPKCNECILSNLCDYRTKNG